MADDNLTVRFSADVGAFNAAIQSAAKATSSSTDQMRMSASQARDMFNQFGTDLSKVKLPLDEINNISRQVADSQKTLADAVKKTNEAFKLAGPGIGFYAREAHALIDESLSGRMNQFQGTLANVVGTFAAANPALGGASIAALSFGAAMVYAAEQMFSFKGAFEQAKLNSIGQNFQTLDADIKKALMGFRTMHDQGSTVFSGLSFQEGRQVFAEFEAAAKGHRETILLMETITKAWREANHASSTQLIEFSKSLAKSAAAAEDAQKTLEVLGQLNKNMTADQRETAKAAAESGNALQRLQQILQGYSDAVLRQVEVARRFDAETIKSQSSLAGGARSIAEATSKTAAMQAKYDALTKSLRENSAAASQSMRSSDQLAEAMDHETKKYQTLGEKLAEFQNEEIGAKQSVDQLRAALEQDPNNSGLVNKIEVFVQRLAQLGVIIRDVKAELAGGSEYQKAQADIASWVVEGKRGAKEIVQAKIEAEKALISTLDPNIEATKILEAQKRLNAAVAELNKADLKDYQHSMELKELAAKENKNKILQLKQEELSELKRRGYSDDSEDVFKKTKQIEAAKAALKKEGSKESERIETEETKTAIANIETQMEAVKDAANTKQISRREELQQLVELEKEKLRVNIESINNQVKSEREKNALIEKAEAESERNRAKLKAQVDKQIIAEDRQTASEITNSFMGTATSILKGQMTLKQGLLQIGEQILTAQIKQYATNFLQKTLFNAREKVATQALNTELIASTTAAESAKTGVTEAGETARVAAVATGGAEGKAATMPFKISEIMGDSAMTFAGVFANLSPVMGPAAAGPAAAAQGVVAAKAAEIPSFAVGSWELPSDMTANVHKGEMIVPAKPADQLRDFFANYDNIAQNQSFRDQINFAAANLDSFRSAIPKNMVFNPAFAEFASGSRQNPLLSQIAQRGEIDRAAATQAGGDTHHHDNRTFHVGFVDTNGADAFIKRHSEKLAKAVTASQNLNPSLRGKW